MSAFPPRAAPTPTLPTSNHLWNPPPNGNTQAAGGSGGGGAGGGLQLPTKMAASVGPTPVGTSSAAPPVKAAAKQASPDAPEAPEAKQTDVDALMDAVGISGVNVDAEEESMRQANERQHQPTHQILPGQDRGRKQDFIDPGVLAECVKKIAAAFQLRTLEPDTIPLIALATRHRLMSIINDAIAARDHRLSSSHLRLPPLTTRKRKRSGSDGEDDDEDEDDDDFDEDFDEDFEEREAKRRRREEAKGKAREPEPAWDVVVYDDMEKVLGVLERVDREEERKKRRERMLRDQKEEEERALEDAIKASEEAQRSLDDMSSSSGMDNLVMGGGGATGASGSATPKAGAGDDSKDKKPKKPKKKKDTPAVTARNMSEDVKKRLTDQSAMRQLGGRSFSWLNSGTGGAAGSSAAFSSPSPGALPKPKFAPASSLPPPTFGAPQTSGEGSGTAGGVSTSGHAPHIPSALGRLSNVPPLHDANRAKAAKEEWERGAHVVELGDLVWALERERGMGVGKGTGRNVLLRSRAGLPARGTPGGGAPGGGIGK